MLIVVLNAWVTETNDTRCPSRSSTSLAKSASDRVSRSTLETSANNIAMKLAAIRSGGIWMRRYIITIRRMTSGELLKYRNGLLIAEANTAGTAREFALTPSSAQQETSPESRDTSGARRAAEPGPPRLRRRRATLPVGLTNCIHTATVPRACLSPIA
jgi:hypothetical protein